MRRPFSGRRKFTTWDGEMNRNTDLRKCLEIKACINDAKIVPNALNF